MMSCLDRTSDYRLRRICKDGPYAPIMPLQSRFAVPLANIPYASRRVPTATYDIIPFFTDV